MKKNFLRVVGTICLLILLGLGYQFLLLKLYTVEKPDDIEDTLKGLRNSSSLEIHKNTNVEEYLSVGNLKVRNDFTGYVKQEKTNEADPDTFVKEENSKKVVLNFYSEQNNDQLVAYFVQNGNTFFGDNTKSMERKYLSVDRIDFLHKNGIENDVDFYQYIANHYYEENTLFMSRKKMKENYALNLFVSIAVPQIDEIIYITGDYTGYIMRVKDVTQINIIDDAKVYGFYTNDERFLDNSYLKDIIGTIEIH